MSLYLQHNNLLSIFLCRFQTSPMCRQPRSTVTKKKLCRTTNFFSPWLRLAGMQEAELTAVDCSPVTERVWGCSACLHAPVPLTVFFFFFNRRAGQRSRSLIISTWPAPMFVCVLPQKPHFFQAFKPSWSDTEGRLVFKPTRIIINDKLKKTLTSFSGRLSLKLFPHFFSPPASCWSRCYLLFFQADRVEKFREMSFNLAYLFPAHLFLPLPRHPTTLPHPAFLALQLS